MNNKPVSPALRSHFADYAAFHATRGNQACHYVGVPLIVFTLIALLAHVAVADLGGFTLTAAEIILAGVTVWYLTLDVSLALLMLAASAVFAVAGRALPVLVALALFVVGWILQYLGHYVYEKKSPAFYRNLVHLLVGPLWILAKAVRRA
jgi:uncharacterized membrane protein YGL010W